MNGQRLKDWIFRITYKPEILHNVRTNPQKGRAFMTLSILAHQMRVLFRLGSSKHNQYEQRSDIDGGLHLLKINVKKLSYDVRLIFQHNRNNLISQNVLIFIVFCCGFGS